MHRSEGGAAVNRRRREEADDAEEAEGRATAATSFMVAVVYWERSMSSSFVRFCRCLAGRKRGTEREREAKKKKPGEFE